MELKTMNIKGKEYVQVNDRLKAFRSMPEFKGWSLTSEIVELKEDSCTMKAVITDDQGKVRATGYAREVIAKSPVNKFAFVENCETSAWGRALGNLGIGIDSAVCSAEELLQKLAQDIPEKTPAQKAAETRQANKESKDEYLKQYEAWMGWFAKHTGEISTKSVVAVQLTIAGLDRFGLNDKANALNDLLQKAKNDSVPEFKPEEYLRAG